MKKFRAKIKSVLGKVFNPQNARHIAGELIDVLAGIAPIIIAVDKSPKAAAICETIEMLKKIKDRKEQE